LITSRHTELPKKFCARRPNAARLHKNARSVRARCARLRRLYSMHTWVCCLRSRVWHLTQCVTSLETTFPTTHPWALAFFFREHRDAV